MPSYTTKVSNVLLKGLLQLLQFLTFTLLSFEYTMVTPFNAPQCLFCLKSAFFTNVCL